MPELLTADRVMTWSVAVSPPVQGDVRGRARLLERVKTELRERLRRAPHQREVVLTAPQGEIRLRLLSGFWHERCELRLQYLEEVRPGAGATEGPGSDGLVCQLLPDERLERLAARLVGLEGIRSEILTRLHCQWNGLLDRWSAKTGTPVSAPVRALLEDRVPLFALSGPPGVGKSALAQVIAHRYCAETRTSGRLYWLDTGARGNGLVGDFSSRIRTAFRTVAQASGSEPAFLILDEADALAVRRNEAATHQEDRAATACLLQCLDALRGRRVAVFLTTNLAGALDPALLRRGSSFVLGRPDRAARRELLTHCFPQLTASNLEKAAATSSDMTHADIERVALRVCLQSIQADSPITAPTVLAALKCGERTGDL